MLNEKVADPLDEVQQQKIEKQSVGPIRIRRAVLALMMLNR